MLVALFFTTTFHRNKISIANPIPVKRTYKSRVALMHMLYLPRNMMLRIRIRIVGDDNGGLCKQTASFL